MQQRQFMAAYCKMKNILAPTTACTPIKAMQIVAVQYGTGLSGYLVVPPWNADDNFGVAA